MATRYWVGGTGTWDNTSTANWSATSGGATGASAPTNVDDVIFDALSGTGTCTTAATATARDTTLNSGTLGLTLGADLTLVRSFVLTSGTLDLNNQSLTCLTFASTNSNTRSIAFGTGNITVTGNAATVWNMGTATNFTFTGTPTVNLTYSGATGTRAISFTTGATATNALNFNVTAGTDTVTLPFVSKNFSFTGFSGTLSLGASGSIFIYGDFTLSSGMTVTGGGVTLNFAATSGTQKITTAGKTLDTPITQNSPGATIQLQDNLTMGSTRTFALTAGTLDLTGNSGNWTLNTGIFSSSNSNTRSILFGTGQITVTGNATTAWSMANATGFTYTGTSKIVSNYSGSTGTRNLNFGQTAGATESNALNFFVTAGTDSVAVFSVMKNVDFTGFSGAFLIGSAAIPRTIYGNFIFSSTATVTGGDAVYTFAATSGTQQFTSNGKTFDCPFTVNAPNATVAFQDTLTQGSTRNFTITNGTVQFKNAVTSTVGNFLTSGTNQKFLQSTSPGSQATLSQASGTVNASYLTIRDINATGGATFNAFTGAGSAVSNNNINSGNNTGWNFIPSGSGFLSFF